MGEQARAHRRADPSEWVHYCAGRYARHDIRPQLCKGRRLVWVACRAHVESKACVVHIGTCAFAPGKARSQFKPSQIGVAFTHRSRGAREGAWTR